MSQAFETKAWLEHYGDWTPHSLEYGDTTLLDCYDNNLALNGDKPATAFFGRQMSYNELDKQVRGAAAGLRALGVRPGDCVVIALPNCPQHIVAYWAVLKLGAIVVEHNPLYTAHELEAPFNDHKARVAIVWDKAVATLEKLRHTTPLETIVSVNMIEAMPKVQQLALRLPIPAIKKKRDQLHGTAPRSIPFNVLMEAALGGQGEDLESNPEVTKDSIALILYTSGTTGSPKGAQLSHGNLFANLLQGKAWVKGLGNQDERMLGALPLFHAYGVTIVMNLAIYVGACVELLPAPQIPLIMKVMKKRTPTWVPGVPTLYQKIVDAAKAEGININGVRNSFSGASTLPTSTVEQWEELTGGLLVEGYGLTETGPIITGNPMSSDRRPGYVGIPFPDTEIRIANPDNPSETQPDGTEGEVLVRGPQVFQGYLNQPEATAASFHEGWYRTGDVGVMESDGFIRLVARIKEVIITGGFNVYPAEVEEVLNGHPDVSDSAVVGLPRPDGSENVVAAITLRQGAALDPEGLKQYCRENLTRYKVPRTFYHFDELNRDLTGKIRRREVQAEIINRSSK
ncbi:long-chain-fatty-acid--CoA ligase [Corynebacterium sp. 153RC1]|uniref:long-chain-fatty-acid--CoA ligase n=1 Tax=unclassified Corynebacterium TaxID=2624378 RepID=UPI00211BC1D3|nr:MULTISPECIES: long-chain-fatty-acid--CoA ligase [unclassified Corynebacterium]MCQ9370584.1 long-chain-fatty-acid--CoA ligase [Corynebacterium sp. 35RC1]MCQ9351761.1 long-chain-fatty-acid--CoA ligase [Corynebacterium sp. 209RC1]MCQ9354497.1 long-chain-fatty-acid--CoA ligase [Corynebacterium sp. 1222RC1]MCQ9356043.1 long-chain-fatty-acid--CoA ligase [Corynebacterium sp. 122RC1]MCQ9358675.1 long-chain-fatty-acid--CoA ligase [Corynebacterium sp. 142RC1]